MDQPPQPQQPKSRKTLVISLLLAAAAALTIGVAHFSSQTAPTTPDDAGFDIAGPAPTPEPALPEPSAAPAQPQAPAQSGLGMVDAGGIKIGGAGDADAAAQRAAQIKKAERTLTDIVRANEKRVEELAKAYAKKYPVMLQYEKEWMTHPELRQLANDYKKNHDPIAFVRGLSKSPNFGPMVRKYATQAPIQRFVMEIYTKAPSEASEAATLIFSQENKGVTRLVNNFTTALGVGPLLDVGIDDKVQKKGTLEAASQTQLNP